MQSGQMYTAGVGSRHSAGPSEPAEAATEPIGSHARILTPIAGRRPTILWPPGRKLARVAGRGGVPSISGPPGPPETSRRVGGTRRHRSRRCHAGCLGVARRKRHRGSCGPRHPHRLGALPELVGIPVRIPAGPPRLRGAVPWINAPVGDRASGGQPQRRPCLQSGRPGRERGPHPSHTGLLAAGRGSRPVHRGELRRAGNGIERAAAVRAIAPAASSAVAGTEAAAHVFAGLDARAVRPTPPCSRPWTPRHRRGTWIS